MAKSKTFRLFGAFFFVYTIYEFTSFDHIYLAGIEKYSNGFADDKCCCKFINSTSRILYGDFAPLVAS